MTALEAEVARLKDELAESEGYCEGFAEDFAWFQMRANAAARLETDLATLTAEHARLTARWEALRVWAQARYDETENLDDVASWAYERMKETLCLEAERDGDHP